MALMREWGDMKPIPAFERSSMLGERRGLILHPARSVWLELFCIWIVSISQMALLLSLFNIGGLGYGIAFAPVADALGGTGNSPSWLAGVLLLIIAVWILVPALFILWVLELVAGLFSPFIFSCVWKSAGRGFLRPVSVRPFREQPHFAPAFSTVTTVVLSVLAYEEFAPRGRLAYDCSTTWKSSFYDYYLG